MEGLVKGANPFWAAFFLLSRGRLICWKLLCKSTTLFSSLLIGVVTIPPLVYPSFLHRVSSPLYWQSPCFGFLYICKWGNSSSLVNLYCEIYENLSLMRWEVQSFIVLPSRRQTHLTTQTSWLSMMQAAQPEFYVWVFVTQVWPL